MKAVLSSVPAYAAEPQVSGRGSGEGTEVRVAEAEGCSCQVPREVLEVGR